MWCDVVDAETGQVSIDMLQDPNCWSDKRRLLDVLVRLQVSSYTVEQRSSHLSIHVFFIIILIFAIHFSFSVHSRLKTCLFRNPSYCRLQLHGRSQA